MNSSLRLPTDNPYKLMAIIGAVIFVFGLYYLLSRNEIHNDRVFQAAEKIAMIAEREDLTDTEKDARVAIESRKLEIIKSDRELSPYICALISTIGGFLCFIGFRHWIRNVYPDEEAMRKEQLKSLRLANLKASRVRLGKRE